jgi:nucleoside-diphosphate-sugar epimerase
LATYLITGGAGFIGSHLAAALTSRGDSVIVLDDLSTGSEDNLGQARQGEGDLRFLRGDICDYTACQEAVEPADYVIHLAARARVQRSIENPEATHQVNVNGGLNVLNAARRAGVKRVVYASSSSVYGDRTDPAAPKREDMDVRPASPYAAGKVSLESYCRAYSRSMGLETVSLRYFNVFGPRQDPDSQYAAVIPRFLFAVLNGETPVVFGDGRQSRDFTYIDNVVQANLAACVSPRAAGGVYNIASGRSIDLITLLEMICKLTGKQTEPEFAEPRVGDVRHSLADLSRAKADLDYRVLVDFEQGLSTIVDLAREGKYLAQ